MNTIIEKIRAEVNKLPEEYKGLYKQFGNSLGFIDGLDMVKKILSDLEKEEKPMNPEAAMKELDEKIALVKQRRTWDGVDVDKYMDEVRGREPEKPIQEGLEEEIERYLHSLGVGYGGWVDGMEDDDLRGVACHFAQWGAEHRGPSGIPNDLEEAANEYAQLDNKGVWKDGGKYKGFIAGAKWQAEQDQETIELAEDHAYLAGAVNEREKIMKEAVEGEVTETCGIASVWIKTKQFKPGQKVRIIVCKKED